MAKFASGSKKGLPLAASLPRMMRAWIRNSVRNSRCQFPTSPAGGTISTRWMSRRESNSRIVRPVMMVLPAPASSASRKRIGQDFRMWS